MRQKKKKGKKVICMHASSSALSKSKLQRITFIFFLSEPRGSLECILIMKDIFKSI